ncbi:Sjogren's syndrome/scleroderma autoantigen 1 family protein [Natrinema sp. J7-2]|uniref:Sjogren's syndrome/scleroderma autoantigen 1 family protein n=1 Tax=Natrinema sp. (strain J7-2) TaxID=406552 RepID=UPI00026D491C|nr:Sjogren's syndrome/scleroderma autoantigen 1 family protein [Natrinema sp. J7-2]AFO55668.1 Sjogrens syndrome scleroderma autoantigen 1 [Natrinema sp. J7-2]
MSDFDKEAEREKLREKYEQDKEERKATQRMSDLLLKGATMTNAHCGTCGDPLFQDDGTTFCPSCHGTPDAVQGTDLEAQSAAEGAGDGTAAGGSADRPDADAAAPETDDAATTSADAASESGQPTATDPRDADRGRETSAPTPDRQPQPSSPARDDSPTQSRPDAASAARSASTPRPDDRRSDSDRNRPLPATGPSSADGDLDAARDALVRSLEKFAEAAAATDDPRYAADCLEAAREAGETLATLR